MNVDRLSPQSAIRNPKSEIGVVFLFALVCVLAVCFASWRHTGSLAFPIDDGYIYSNYVLSAAQGEPFVYNPGETSGGITGLGWYFLCVVAYWLLTPFHGFLGALAPLEVRQVSEELAQQAGHLYLAAYLPGALCLAVTAVGVYRLAHLALPQAARNPEARGFLCLALGMIAGADLGLVWGALSGLEVAMSSALVVWAVVLLLSDVRRGALRWSLVVAALLPLARPDLLAFSVACGLWLLVRALAAPSDRRGIGFRHAALYVGAIGAGLAAMCAIYFLGWGRPLPSSFYAKVGGLRFGSKMLAAIQELIIAGRTLPFVGAGLALAGGLVGVLPSPRGRASSGADEGEDNEARWASLLLLMASASYVLALLLTLPWFGQEDRYLLPLHPLAIVLVGILVWRILDLLAIDRLLARPAARPVLLAGLGLALVSGCYLWATRNYVVEVRNIRDAHILPALWIEGNTPPDSALASEPIGAVRLFSGRRTIDLVGLTTPATLGTYRDWPEAWPALEAAGATHLLYYPDWFDDGEPPAWAVEAQRFRIPDNRIAGSDVIAVYGLDWRRLTEPP